jgi:hypothetical protein
MNRRDRRRAGKRPYRALRDSDTGERYIPLDDLLHYWHQTNGPITRIELIRRMRDIGGEFRYVEATNPAPPHETIGIDFVVLPDAWERRWAA